MEKKRLKIAFLNIYNGLVNRGAETFVSEVAQRLSKQHQVLVIQGGLALEEGNYKETRIPYDTDWQIPEEFTSSRSLEYYLKRLLFDGLGLHILTFTLKSIPVFLREKPDVVIPVNGRWQTPIVRVVTWLYGGKMVVSGQSGIGRDDILNLWSMPDAFVALSNYAKNWAESKNPLTRVERIPNGVDTEKFTPKGDKIHAIIKRPIILFVGALEEGKRPLHTIQAVSKMESKANLFFVYGGDGKLRTEVQKVAEHLLGPFNTRFSIKSFRHGAMPMVYRTADVFTIPSKRHYSFEIVLVEAMASGLPVVTNDDPIRREIVGDAGILIDPEDTEGYAKALDKALQTNWGDKPRKQAEKFSWDKIAEQYENLFYSLTGK